MSSLVYTAAYGTHEFISILSESFSEDSIEEGIGTRIDGKKEDQQNFGVGNCDEGKLKSSRDGKEGDGCHAQKIREDEYRHALCDPGVCTSG